MAQEIPSIVWGPSSPVPIHMTAGQLLDHYAEIRGNRPAVISHHQGIELSFAELRRRSIQLARAMSRDGIGKGDLVAIALGNRVEYFETFFAIARLGAALVLLNFASTENEMLALLTSIRPKMFVTTPGFTFYDYRKMLARVATEVPSIRTFIIADDIQQKYKFETALERSHNYTDYINQAGNARLPDVSISPHDMVNVQFTSGSTGLPKSVALSHFNILNCGRYIWQQTRMSDRDRICLPVPLFHSFGMIVGISSSIVAGSALILPHEIYNSKATLQTIEKYKCTAIYGVPTMFVTEMAEKDFKSIDTSTIEFGIIAGAAMPPELLKRIVNDFPVPRLYTCWGMTELSSFVTMMHETDPYEKRIKTAGRLFPHFVAKIVKPNTGEAVPWGEKGEIVASGYGQMSEYLNNKAKTDETLRFHPQDLEPGGAGGIDGTTRLRKWLHTGDEGYLDPDGYFVISGRIKDLVIRGGENISPMEIEDRLIEHQAIAQASIVGVPDEKYGEELGAFVELRSGNDRPSDDELRDFVKEKLARFKAPRYFWWLDGGKEGVPTEWPKTTSGKISKPDLRKVVEKLI